MNHKKKITFYIITIALLLIIIITYSYTKSLFKTNLDEFAVEDTTSVCKVFISDKANHSVLIEKQRSGLWKLNKVFDARNDGVNLLLKTISKVEIKSPVAKESHNTVVSRLASIGVKVEIYQKKHYIDIFGLKLFEYEKHTKTYYVGDATQDLTGTYMLLEGSPAPYIVNILGFTGFLTPRYSPREGDWREHTVFNLRINQIKNISVEYPHTPDSSFAINHIGNGNFDFYDLRNNQKNKIVKNLDTIKIIEYLTSFKLLNFENLINDLDKKKKDSIISSGIYCIINITDVNNSTKGIKTFRKKANIGEIDEISGNPVFWDRDRLYGLFNNDKDFALIQYYLFDKVIKPKQYFYKK